MQPSWLNEKQKLFLLVFLVTFEWNILRVFVDCYIVISLFFCTHLILCLLQMHYKCLAIMTKNFLHMEMFCVRDWHCWSISQGDGLHINSFISSFNSAILTLLIVHFEITYFIFRNYIYKEKKMKDDISNVGPG